MAGRGFQIEAKKPVTQIIVVNHYSVEFFVQKYERSASFQIRAIVKIGRRIRERKVSENGAGVRVEGAEGVRICAGENETTRFDIEFQAGKFYHVYADTRDFFESFYEVELLVLLVILHKKRTWEATCHEF